MLTQPWFAKETPAQYAGAGPLACYEVSGFRYYWRDALLVMVYPLLTVLYIWIVFHLYRTKVIASSISFALVQYLTSVFTSIVLSEGCKEFSSICYIESFFVDVFRFTDLVWGSVLRGLSVIFFNATLSHVVRISGIPVVISLSIVLFYIALYLGTQKPCSNVRCSAIIVLIIAFVVQSCDGETLEKRAIIMALLFAFTYALHQVNVSSSLQIFSGHGGEKQLCDHETFTGILIMLPLATYMGYMSFSWPFIHVMNYNPGLSWFDFSAQVGCIALVGILSFALSVLRTKLLSAVGGVYWQIIDLIAPFILFVAGFCPAVSEPVTLLCGLAFVLVAIGRILNAIDFASEYSKITKVIDTRIRRQAMEETLVRTESLKMVAHRPSLKVKSIGILHSTGKLELFDPLP